MKSTTLKENKEFRRLYYRGRSISSPELVTYAMKSKLGATRYGITTSKKIGNAVKRNRARRIIRSAFAELEPRIIGNYDFVFVARSKTAEIKTQDVLCRMEEQLKELGVIKD